MTKTKIGAPKEKRSKHNLTCTNYTTSDLFKIQPVFSREIIKGDIFDIRTKQINRVDALPVSSFVEIENRHDWFYVKFNQVWKPFDAFKSKTPYAFDYQNAIPSKVPYFTLSELFVMFTIGDFTIGETTHNLSTVVDEYDTIDLTNMAKIRQDYKDHKFDFVAICPASSISNVEVASDADVPRAVTFKLNAIGRQVYSILYSLGYRVPAFFVNTDSNVFSSGQKSAVLANFQYSALMMSKVEVSALPMMSYLSVLMNYYVPTKFRDYTFVNSMSYLVNPIKHADGLDFFNLYKTAKDSDLIYLRSEIIKLLIVNFYGSDYFTDSLQQPFDSATPFPTDPSLELDWTSGSNIAPRVSSYSNGGNEPILENRFYQNSVSKNGASQYLLAALSASTSKAQIRALTKNNLLGSLLQQFGIKPESADMIPYNLGTNRSSIVVEPEIATAATDLAPLGYKAGSGQGSATFANNFEFDNFGILICVNSISPEISLVDGLNREMVHVARNDFFDPAYVNLGYQAVANFELTLNPDAPGILAGSADWDYRSVFGFQNKFSEYGYKKDSAGGDFCINSISQGMDAFHFIRKFDGQVPDDLANNERFAQAKLPYLAAGRFVRFVSQYDRIFQLVDADYDHIQQWTRFEILATRSIPANGEFQIGEAERIIEGKSITDNINN